VDQESLFDRFLKFGQGIVLQEPQDPDKFPRAFPFLFLLSLEATMQRVKALGEVQIHQGSGLIPGSRFSFQKGQIVAVVEKDPFFAPRSRVLGYHLVSVA
jgi:hypothetical protein